MTLQFGDWTFNGNGIQHSLHIEGVDPKGRLSGNMGGTPILGTWDETSRVISFAVISNAGPVPIFYEGCLFSTPADPPPGEDLHWTLARVLLCGWF